MIKFTLKFILFFTLLFISVLIGMQQASVGIREMKGYDDPYFGSAFEMTEGVSGEVEAALLGEKVTSHDIRIKQEKLEEMEAFNFFSELGSKFANGVSTLLKQILNLLSFAYICSI